MESTTQTSPSRVGDRVRLNTNGGPLHTNELAVIVAELGDACTVRVLSSGRLAIVNIRDLWFF